MSDVQPIQNTGALPDRTPPALLELLGQTVVVDTDSHYIFIGKLERADAQFLLLSGVDVHDNARHGLSKERYVHEARNIGVRQNREHTYVRMDRVVCISKLEMVNP